MLWDDWEMQKLLFINAVYFKIHPTGGLGADIKIKIENILGQTLGECKLAWEFPWLPAKPATFTPPAFSCSQLNKVNSTSAVNFARRGREKEVKSLRYL